MVAEEEARARRRRWAVASTAVVVALLALGGVWATIEIGGGKENMSAPSAAEVRRVHAALHAVDRVCSRPPISLASRRVVARDARMFARFADAHPRAEFRIDDEEGRAVSLLLVARQTLQRCDRRAAAIVDRALPAAMRNKR